jgi:hypothetical protein
MGRHHRIEPFENRGDLRLRDPAVHHFSADSRQPFCVGAKWPLSKHADLHRDPFHAQQLDGLNEQIQPLVAHDPAEEQQSQRLIGQTPARLQGSPIAQVGKEKAGDFARRHASCRDQSVSHEVAQCQHVICS